MIFLIVFIILFLLIIIKSFFEVNSFHVTSYVVCSDKIKEQNRFVFLSDLHNRTYNGSNDKLLGAIESMAPDAVLICGDMIVKGKTIKYDNSKDLIKTLCQKYKIFYVFGNHEQKEEERISEYIKELEEAGVVFVNNKQEDFGNIIIEGVTLDLKHYKKHLIHDNIDIELPKFSYNENNVFRILLAHHPLYFKEYLKINPDLILSGHLHGGVFPLFYGRGLLSPQMHLFPKYAYGEFESTGTRMIVSRGIGSHKINLRLFNHPEVVVLEIKPKIM